MTSRRSSGERVRSTARPAAERAEGATAAPAGRPALAASALSLALLTGTLIALHGYVLRFPFISDDYVFLCDIWNSSWRNLFGAFNTVQNYFRPLGRELYFYGLSLAIGNDPLAFRLVNLAVLVTIVGGVLALAWRFAGPRAGILAAATYALLYPHRVEMAWVSCSQDLIATVLALAAALAHLVRRPVTAGVAFFLALFAKESVAPLPLILVAWEAWNTRPRPPVARLAPALVRRTGTLWLAAGSWAAVVLAVRAWRGAWAPGSSLPVADITLRLDRFWEGFRSGILTYVYFDQPWSYLSEGFRGLRVPWLAIGLLVALAVLASRLPGPRAGAAPARVAAGRRLGLAWAILGLVPVALVGHHFSAYYVCFAAVGFALLAGEVLARLPVAGVAAALAVAATLNVAANSTQTFLILSDEDDFPGVSYVPISRLAQEARFLDSLRVAMLRDPPPRGAMVYLSHAPHRASFATAGERAPQVWFRDTSLGLAAIGQYRPGRTSRPHRFYRFDGDTRGFVSLPRELVDAVVEGEDHMARGDWSRARAAFARALGRARPRVHDLERTEVGNSLGVAANREGDPAGARAVWEQVLGIDPEHRGALLNLAGLDAGAGRYAEAKVRVVRLLESQPRDALALLYLTRLERALGNSREADRAWARLVAVDEGFADSVLRFSGPQ